MLFHKFQKVPPILFEMPLDLSQWGQKLPPKKYVNVLPCMKLKKKQMHKQIQCQTNSVSNKFSVNAARLYERFLQMTTHSFHKGVKQMATCPLLQAGNWMLLQIVSRTTC